MRRQPFWRSLLRLTSDSPETDIDQELDFHFTMRVEDLMRRGMSEDDARSQARREFGDVERIRREMNDIGRKRQRRENRAGWWDSAGHDFRLAARTLKSTPGFSAVVILTLGLAIGGTTAVFSVVEAVLLAPLPYNRPGQLVRIYQSDDGFLEASRSYLSGPHVNQVRDNTSSFESVAALYTYRDLGLDLTGQGRAERMRVLAVSSHYFRVLQSPPAHGREFTREDEANGRWSPVGLPHVILSHELWLRRFAGDVSIIGSVVRLSAEPYTVVGIARAGFEDPIAGRVDAWVPLDFARTGASNEQNHFLTLIGRLRNDAALEQARSELGTLNRALAELWPGSAEDTLVVVPLKEDLVGAARGTLQLLLLAVGLVLLVACVNVANLVLVRSTGRSREYAIRSALGAGGMRIARQLLVESVILASLGGMLGLIGARVGVDALLVLGRDAVPRLGEVGFDPLVLAFAALVTLATGIVCGIAPALRSARTLPSHVLREQSRSATGSRRQGRLRTALATAQLALALMLVASAGVLILSFHRVQQVDLGFRPEGVLTFAAHLPEARYDATQRAAFQEEFARRLETIPGTAAAGGASWLPANGSYHNWGTRLVSGPHAGEDSWIGAEQRIVSGRFFEAIGIPVLAGRVFDERDDGGAPPRAVVSESIAREVFDDRPLADVIGQRIAPLGEEREIIGVVGDVALDARGTPAPTIYQAHLQYADDRNWAIAQVVATDGDPERILSAVRAELSALDPDVVLYRPMPLTDVVGRGVSRDRFALVLMGAFAAMALILAALGLYGVLSYAVRHRTQEIGIRIALGASRSRVRAMVLKQALVVLAIGVPTGILGALALGRWLASLVFQTSPWEPRVLGATILVLTGVAIVSAWLPARRASRVEPRTAFQET